jgi:hypothetical protein
MPGLKRLGDYNTIPKIEDVVLKHNPSISKILSIYLVCQFYLVVHVVSKIIESPTGYNPIYLSLMVILFVYSLWTIGCVFDKRAQSIKYECLRCLFWILFDLTNSQLLLNNVFSSNETIYLGFKATNVLSFVALSSTSIFKSKYD